MLTANSIPSSHTGSCSNRSYFISLIDSCLNLGGIKANFGVRVHGTFTFRGARGGRHSTARIILHNTCVFLAYNDGEAGEHGPMAQERQLGGRTAAIRV